MTAFHDVFGLPLPATYYPEALTKALTNHDFIPNFPELYVSVNSNINWYMGTDGNTGGKYDLRTAVLRELASGLGLTSSFWPFFPGASWGRPFSPALPWVMDRFIANGSGQVLVNTFPNNSVALQNQLFSANLFFNGPSARAANGGLPPKMSAPSVWTIFNQLDFLDEATYPPGNPNALLTPVLNPGEVIHKPGPIVLGMMRDIGWTVVRRSNTAADFDGDSLTDIAVFRPSNGTWFIVYSGTGTTAGIQWGNGLDVPVPGDYDGDGKADIAVFRPSNGTWFLQYSGTGSAAGIQWGNGNDKPVPGDYDGDGKTDIAIFRPSNGTWFIQYSGTGTAAGIQWGNGNDRPVPGDYDGDGTTDIAVFRPSNGTWFIVYSGTGTAAGIQWGNGNDVAVPGDYDGDGKTDVAVFRPSNGTWFIQYSSTGTFAGIQWGNGLDVPVPGDYDGDGKTDIAVFRPSNGTWFLQYSGTGTVAGIQWGNANDIPMLKR